MEVYRKLTKRGVRVINGLAQTDYMVKMLGEPPRRIYEHWAELNKHGSTDSRKWTAPLVLNVRGQLAPLDPCEMPLEYNGVGAVKRGER